MTLEAKVLTLYDGGMTINDISEKLNIGEVAVKHALRGNILTKEWEE